MMKKKLIIILVIACIMTPFQSFGLPDLDIFVSELRAAEKISETQEVIPAAANGYELYFNAYFTDLRESTYEKQIAKMASMGVVHKYGDWEFRPESKMIGYEALEFLVNLQGSQPQVQQNVLAQSTGLDKDSVQQLYNEAYLEEAQNLGIVTDEEIPGLKNSVTKLQVAKWVFRTAGLQEQFGDLSSVYGFEDWLDVPSEDRGIVQAVVNAGLMSYGNDGNFSPEKSISRGEMTWILDNMLTRLEDTFNIESDFGIVIEKAQDTTETEEVTDFLVKKSDNTMTKINVRHNKDTNQENEFVVYKDGIVRKSSAITIGDEINYFIKDGEVVFVNVLNDASVLEKINKVQKESENAELLFATVRKISTEREETNETIFENKRIRIQTKNGNTYDVIIPTDLQTGITEDILTYKEDHVGGTNLLEEEDDIQLIVENDNAVVYIKEGTFETTAVTGSVREITETSIQVFDYNNQIQNYPLSEYLTVEVNNRPGEIGDLSYGQDVSLEVNGGFVTAIRSETFINPGYIPTFGKVKTGTIYKKYNGVIQFELNDGSKAFYKLTDDTQLIKGDRQITTPALKEGDQVKLYFDDIYTDELSKVEVQGVERLISQVYKGKLDHFNQGTMTLTIKDPKYLKNTQWIDTSNYSKSIQLDDHVEIFNNNQPIRLRDLIRKFKDDTAYIVVEGSFGKERGMKVTIKQGGEFMTSDKIDSVDRALNRFELDNRQNINYTDGTIILKDSRILPQELLSDDDTVLVVSEFYQGQTTANLVKVTTMFDQIFENIYLGTIEDVNYNSITLNNHTSLDGNEFNQVTAKESQQYYMFTSTKIEDITDPDDKKALSKGDFFHGEYSRTENESEDGDGVPFEKYYTYFVTNGDQGIISMKLRHKGLMKNQDLDDTNNKVEDANEELQETLDDAVLTKGVVSERFDTFNRLKLTDSHDYMGYLGGWKANNNDTYFEYTDAIIIKDEEAITAEEIKVGDTLYVLRIKEDALTVFVEDE